MSNESETALAQSATRGDLESFGQLCRRYHAPMLAIAYSVLADQHLAQDAAQEAFAKALVALPQLRQPERFGPWLGRICRNVAMDMLKARPRHGGSESLWQVTDDRCEHESNRAVRRALARLPADVRELIVLRYYDSLPYEQIASVLGLSHSAVNGRLVRARKMLAKALIREGILEDCHEPLG